MSTTTLAISGMSCQNCVRHVTRTLAAVPGVTVREVTVGSATIETTSPEAAAAAARALAEEGYPAAADAGA
jgi:Cu+-exporting ATPase